MHTICYASTLLRMPHAQVDLSRPDNMDISIASATWNSKRTAIQSFLGFAAIVHGERPALALFLNADLLASWVSFLVKRQTAPSSIVSYLTAAEKAVAWVVHSDRHRIGHMGAAYADALVKWLKKLRKQVSPCRHLACGCAWCACLCVSAHNNYGPVTCVASMMRGHPVHVWHLAAAA